MYFVICPKQGPIIKGVVLHRVGILEFCLVLNAVRVSADPQRHPYSQTWVKCAKASYVQLK